VGEKEGLYDLMTPTAPTRDKEIHEAQRTYDFDAPLPTKFAVPSALGSSVSYAAAIRAADAAAATNGIPSSKVNYAAAVEIADGALEPRIAMATLSETPPPTSPITTSVAALQSPQTPSPSAAASSLEAAYSSTNTAGNQVTSSPVHMRDGAIEDATPPLFAAPAVVSPLADSAAVAFGTSPTGVTAEPETTASIYSSPTHPATTNSPSNTDITTAISSNTSAMLSPHVPRASPGRVSPRNPLAFAQASTISTTTAVNTAIEASQEDDSAATSLLSSPSTRIPVEP
jgi:hypothetical protein